MTKALKILLLESYRKFLNEDVSPEVIERFKNLPNDELCNLILTNRIDQDIFNGLFNDFVNSKYYANDEDGDEKRDKLAMELIASKYATVNQLKEFIDKARIHKADKFRVKEAIIKYNAKRSNQNVIPNLPKSAQTEEDVISDEIKELENIPIVCLKRLIAQNKLTPKEFIQLFNWFMTSKFYNTLSNGDSFRDQIARTMIVETLSSIPADRPKFKELLRKFVSPRFKQIHQCSKAIIRLAKDTEKTL